MGPSELLRFVAGVLEKLGIRYFVTGSMATVFYGEPRFTNDIDVVVDLPPGKVAAFCVAFPEEDFYLSEESARRAVARRGQFNVIHPRSGLKVDGVLKISGEQIDRSYIEDWVSRLGLEEVWQEVLRRFDGEAEGARQA